LIPSGASLLAVARRCPQRRLAWDVFEESAMPTFLVVSLSLEM